MDKTTIRRIMPGIILFLFLIPVVTSSLLDLQQKEKNELLFRQAKMQKEADDKAREEALEKIYLMGKFEPEEKENFTVVPIKYNIGGYTMYLRKETLEAFLKMAEAAEKGGVELKIASATRNFDYQKNIWNNKWTGATLVDGDDLSKTIPDGLERFKKILEYSAVPGTSRHHWGTDIDINDANLPYFETTQGEEVYDWLVENAEDFGFCQTYTKKGSNRPTGYNEEKWHWSYVPLARTFTKEYKDLITDADIEGFDGDEYVASEDLINNYVLGINPECL